MGSIITTLVIIFGLYILLGIRVLMEYERGIKFTLGKFTKVMKPGIRIVFPIIQSYQKVDIRIKTVDVPKQDCITKDNVSVSVDAVTYYAIIDVKKAILNVEDYYYAVSQLSQTTMRDVIGSVTLDSLLANRDEVSDNIRNIIEKTADSWGVKIDKVELRKIDLPDNMRRIMAREAEAEREKRGIIIKSEGEIIASQNLAKAAMILTKYNGAMQLRTLQTINDISSDPSQKFLFFPIDIGEIFKKK